MAIKLNRNSGIIILVIATFFWGSTFAFTKELTNDLTPLWIVGIRFGLTALILLAVFFKQIFSIFKVPLRKELPKLLLLGFVNFLAILLQTMSLEKIPASNNGFITSVALLLVPFIEFIFRKKKVKNNIKIAMAILFIGIYILSYGLNPPNVLRLGDVLALISAIVYAFYIVLVDILAKKINAGAMMFFVFSVTGIISIPLAFILDGNIFSLSKIVDGSLFSFNTYFNMGFLIGLGTIIPYIFMGTGQRYVDAQTSSMVYILEPVFAMFIAIVFFSEEPLLSKFIGGGIILIAQFIGVRETKKIPKLVLNNEETVKNKSIP